MKKFLALLIGAMLAFSVTAETITYVPPSTYTDGTPLPASAITGHEFRCSGATTQAGFTCTTASVAGTATSATITINVPPAGGTACIQGRTFAGALNPSAWTGGTGTACRTYQPIPPNGPSSIVVAFNVTINGQLVRIDPAPAYGITFLGTRSTTVVGFVAEGTPCIGDPVFSYRGRGYRRVAPQNVGWWQTTPTDRVAAPCNARS